MPLVKTLLDDPNFLEFYVTAKKNTYAVVGNGKAETLRNGGKRYVFYDGERWPQWRYTDIYHGNNPFFGNETAEEVGGTMPSIWTPIAQMSYNGCYTGATEEVKRVFAFLGNMLYRVSCASPFRGPLDLVREDGLQYWNSWIRKNAYCIDGEEVIQQFIITMGPIIYQGSYQFCALR